MRSVAVLIAPLLTLLLYGGPALAGQRSSHTVIISNFASRPAFFANRSVFVVPQSRVVIVQRPFIARPVIVARPFVVRPHQVLIVRRSAFGTPFIVERGFVPPNQVFVFERF